MRRRNFQATNQYTHSSIEERFWVKVEFTDSCWWWLASANQAGYGSFWLSGRLVRAHRWAYTYFNGPIPPDRELDHLCRNPPCVNPAHLEVVTHRENGLRGLTPSLSSARYGERNPACKIPDAMAIQIYWAEGSQRQIANAFGVDKTAVWKIKSLKRKSVRVQLEEALK